MHSPSMVFVLNHSNSQLSPVVDKINNLAWTFLFYPHCCNHCLVIITNTYCIPLVRKMYLERNWSIVKRQMRFTVHFLLADLTSSSQVGRSAPMSHKIWPSRLWKFRFFWLGFLETTSGLRGEGRISGWKIIRSLGHFISKTVLTIFLSFE